MPVHLPELVAAESPDALILTTTAGVVRYWSRGAERVFGYPPEQTLGRPLLELIVPAERSAEEARVGDDLIEFGAAVYESMRRRQDGSLIYVDISAKRLRGDAGELLFLYSKKDVTALKARRDAKLVRASFGQLLDSTPDGILLVNATGRIVLANGHAVRMFGYQDDGELIGLAVEQLLPARLRGAHVGHRASYVGQPRVRAMGAGLDLYGLRKDGDEFPVEISLSPLQTDEGTLIFSAIRDSSERKRIERALRDSNTELERANAAKDRFLAGMSHELRTPLNAIIGFTGTLLLKLPGPLTGDQEKHLQTVKASAKHLLALINDLLDLAKIDAGKTELNLQPLAASNLLEEVAAALRPQAERKGLQLNVEIVGALPPLHSDPRLLRQILLNLTSNAIKFTDRGGVTLRIGAVAGELLLQVIDSGIGIRSEDQGRLFEAFSRIGAPAEEEREGTGLGLHLSRKLVELLGGRIEVDSRPGSGSTFSVHLPV